MPPAPKVGNSSAATAYGVSAGLDLLSGVFSYLASVNAASAARSRADLMRAEAEANAQRYAEQAAQFEAHQKVMYLSSGVTLQGSPIDVLATTARIATENIAAIKMHGAVEAADEDMTGVNAEAMGRGALIGGVRRGFGAGLRSYDAMVSPQQGDSSLAALRAVSDYLGGR